MSWEAQQWALTEAPMPKSDPTAHLVLIYLGDRADKHGRDAYPQAATIAHKLQLNAESVSRVLKRLAHYGLISKDGVGPSGQPNWRLHMDQVRPEGSAQEQIQKQRKAEAEKKARYRAKKRVHDRESGTSHAEQGIVHDDESGTVHHRESWTPALVHDSQSGTVHGDGSGTADECPRLRVDMSTTLDRNVHDSRSPQNLSLNQPPITTPPNSAELDLGVAAEEAPTEPAKPHWTKKRVDTEFDRFWAAYPRRESKQGARDKFGKLLKSGLDPDTLISGAERYAAYCQRVGRDREKIKHPTTWLNQGCWEDELDSGPGAPPSDPTEWLRQQWKAGAVAEVERATGLRYTQPDLPPDVKTRGEIDEFYREQAKAWIAEQHTEILTRLTKGTAA